MFVETDWKLDKCILIKIVGWAPSAAKQKSRPLASAGSGFTPMKFLSEILLSWRKIKTYCCETAQGEPWKDPRGTSVCSWGPAPAEHYGSAGKALAQAEAWRTDVLFNALGYLILALESSSSDKMKNQWLLHKHHSLFDKHLHVSVYSILESSHRSTAPQLLFYIARLTF